MEKLIFRACQCEMELDILVVADCCLSQ